VQARGQQIVELNPGDVVFGPHGEEHWHGARPDHFMTHLSISEGPPNWDPHVTDAEYQDQPAPGGLAMRVRSPERHLQSRANHEAECSQI
jgi:hypothetical protein